MRGVAVCTVAKLAKVVVAPALHRSVGEKGTSMNTPRRDSDNSGQSRYGDRRSLPMVTRAACQYHGRQMVRAYAKGRTAETEDDCSAVLIGSSHSCCGLARNAASRPHAAAKESHRPGTARSPVRWIK